MYSKWPFSILVWPSSLGLLFLPLTGFLGYDMFAEYTVFPSMFVQLNTYVDGKAVYKDEESNCKLFLEAATHTST